MLCKNDVLENFAKFTGKHLWQSLSFNKVAGLMQVAGLRSLAQVFSCEFLITPFFTEHIQWLRLYIRRFPYCYKNILLNWKQHLSTDPETISVILSQNIRFNKHIIIDNYMFTLPNFHKKSIEFID